MPSNSIQSFVIPTPSKPSGWGNGYVSIPHDSKWFGVEYDDIPVEVHGGLTFSDYAGELLTLPDHIEPDTWVIGFDTHHAGDDLANWSEEKVIKETHYLYLQIMELNQ